MKREEVTKLLEKSIKTEELLKTDRWSCLDKWKHDTNEERLFEIKLILLAILAELRAQRRKCAKGGTKP